MTDKAGKIEPRLLKGFRDYGLEEQASRQAMFARIQSVFEQFGFLPLSTPVLEYKEILMGKYGDDEKLVYSFKDNGDRDVAMRYDLTVPLARYVAQNLGGLPLPFKRYQIAPVWRADNPQKGRLREFYQCDVDSVGTDSPLSDAEVIACCAKAIESLGVTNYKIRISDRELLKDLSPDAIRSLDKVDKIGIEGITKEMNDRGVSQSEIDLAIQLVEGTRVAVPGRLQKVIDGLKEYGLKGQIEFDPTIARGLDYYSGTVFETVLPEKPEYGSICSGGRYDGLVDQFSSQSLAAVGGSIGIDRLYGALEELGLIPKTSGIQVLVLNQDERYQSEYIKLVTQLRSAGINTELYYEAAKLDKQFKYGERKNIPFAVVMGEEEIASGKVKLKNLSTREQEEVSIDELADKIR
ncbi:histidine--tRNA ligase [bacterium]|nr:MAG: histidine--tRNA ligase [bacterium]